MQVPEWLEEPLLHLVHHSSTTLEGVIDKALAKFSARYLLGEELAALDEGKERPCIIRAITSAKRPDGTAAFCFLFIIYMERQWRAQHRHGLVGQQECMPAEASQCSAPPAWPREMLRGEQERGSCCIFTPLALPWIVQMYTHLK